MQGTLCRWMQGLIVLCLLAQGVLQGAQESPTKGAAPSPEILIINSYAPGYQWSDDVLDGILKVLKNHDQAIEPIIQYLDYKRFPDEQREQWILKDIEYKCRIRPPGLIITMDDPAFDFALKYRQRLGARIPMVFGGVNHFRPEMIAGQANITGVSEESDHHGTFKLIHHLKPGTTDILVIGTQTMSGKESRRGMELTSEKYKGQYRFEFYDTWTNEQLIERVSHLKEGTVGFIIEATQDITGRNNYNDANFSIQLATKSSVPIFINSRPPGDHDWSVDPWDGIGGGLVVANLHGEKVGELAVRVLKGEPAGSIPAVMHTPESMEVDYRQMARFGLSLDLLPPETVVVNAPVNFYQIHRSRIIGAACVFVFLCAVIVTLSVNIFQRRRAEKALKRARVELELLAQAIAQASDMILILGSDGRVKYANPALERLIHLPHSESRTMSYDSLWSGTGDKPAFESIKDTVTKTGHWKGCIETLVDEKFQIRLEAAVSPMREAGGNVNDYLFVGRDTTLESRLEGQLRSSQKMEAVGLLAGGIAHDFNNILQVIQSQCHFLLEEIKEQGELKDGLVVINEAGDRAAQLTRQLLYFSRKQSISQQELNPNLVIADLLKMMRRLIGEHIDIQFVPLKEPCCLHADKGQFEQVILNLCVNARDAMPSGGKILIELQRTRYGLNDVLDRPELKPGDYLLIKVADNGVGMSSEVVSHLFEPFYTTKPIGEGTGLGLSVVYGIIKQHQGSIRVYSEPGSGAEFKILLPLNPEAIASVPRTEESAVIPRGFGTVLIAEDDRQVRSLARLILTRNGFEVIAAEDGQQAIDLIDLHHANLRLVVLDAMMPKLSGRMVYDKIKERYPDIPVLFCSGYSSEMLPKEMAPDSGFALVNKPYTSNDLLKAIHRLLD